MEGLSYMEQMISKLNELRLALKTDPSQSRELSLAKTKLEEADYWLKRHAGYAMFPIGNDPPPNVDN